MAYVKRKGQVYKCDDNNIYESSFGRILDNETPYILLYKKVSHNIGDEQIIPKGAAVNTSNTASTIRGMAEKLGESTLVNRLPLGNLVIGSPARNIALRKNSLEPLNISPAMQGATPNRIRSRDLLSPYTSSMYGLLDNN